MASISEKFCLQWNEFKRIVTTSFYKLRQDEDFVDVTLCCEGRQIKAHRMMLSACSPYFKSVLRGNPCQHPVFFLKDVSYADLAAVIEFVYTGEVNVSQSDLSSFIKTAEMLQVRDLANEDKGQPAPSSENAAHSPSRQSAPSLPPAARSHTPPVTKRSWETNPPPSPSFAKRSRVDAPPRATEPAGPYPEDWSVQLEPTPPPPPPVTSAPPRDLIPHGQVSVKTEVVAQEDGHSLESPLGVDADYSGEMDFMIPDEAGAAGAEDDTGSHGGMFFNEETSTDPSNEAWEAYYRGGPSLSPVVPAAPPGRLACGDCGRTFLHRRTLAQHTKMHQGKTTCMVCGQVMSTVKSLKNHMHTMHAA